MKKKGSKICVIMSLFFLNVVGFSNEGFAQTNTKPVWEFGPEKGGSPSWQALIVDPSAGDGKLRICILNPEERRVVIRISNHVDVDFSMIMKDSLIDQLFNLEQIDDGKYQVEIVIGNERIRKDIFIRTMSSTSRTLEID